MKKLLKPANLLWLALAAGGAGLLLRIWLFAFRSEETGLLRSGHPAELLLWLLTAAVIAVVLLGTRDLTEGAKYSFNFPASLYSAISCVLGGLSIGITSVAELILYQDVLTVIASVLGILSTAALVFVAYGRWKGQPQTVLYHAVICLYLMFRLVSQYRHWSADPQLMNYCFQLLASVCLMLSAYQSAAFDAGSGNRRLHTVFHLGAVYFCCLALPGSENTTFYLGTGIWMMTNLCNLTPRKKREGI